VEEADSLSLAFPVVLETLSPVERAVFLLREVFGHGYDEIARVVEKSSGATVSAPRWSGSRGRRGAWA
jgi:DNA-directed RNA polymerase specialized sigma24 family protein